MRASLLPNYLDGPSVLFRGSPTCKHQKVLVGHPAFSCSIHASVSSQHARWDGTDGCERPDGSDNVALNSLDKGQYTNPRLWKVHRRTL